VYGFPQYYCTGSNWAYFDSLFNLIGSIHATNFDELQEIAVFDLGLEPDQIQILKNIEKVSVHPLEKTHPDITSYYRGHGIVVFGWYAWKPVAIKQALDLFPYVLWLDAGTEVRNSMDFMFRYIQENDYFICTIGDHKDIQGKWQHSVGWGMTQFIKNKFGLDDPEKRWILENESIMGGIIGVSRKGASCFIDDLYEWTRDLRNYADDGTAPNGWGYARHDQVLLSYLAYSRNLTVYSQDGEHGNPIMISQGNEMIPFYITWCKNLVNSNTHIYNVRTEKTNHPYHISKIRKKTT
jgi:hypothetical protein